MMAPHASRSDAPLQGVLHRRDWLVRSAAGLLAAGGAARALAQDTPPKRPALIAITLDLEMSREYPQRGMLEWDFQKGNLDEATKKYSVAAARLAREYGAVIHYFCVGRVLEQADVGWLQEIAEMGHPIGNHTYDHVNVMAGKAVDTQFRFQRAPWLVRGKEAHEVIRENIEATAIALQTRAGIKENGFRTPGGFYRGLLDRPDLQEMMKELGFSWVSSLYPRHQAGMPKQEPSDEVYADIVRAQQEAQPFTYPNGLVEVPMSPISDVGGFRTNYWKLPWFKKAIRMAAEWAIENGAVFDFLCHPSCMVVEDPQLETIRMLCELVREAGPERAQIVGLDKFAERAAPAPPAP